MLPFFMLRIASKTLIPSMMALKAVHDTSTAVAVSPAEQIKSAIAHLFTYKLQAAVDAHRGEEKFAKVNGIYLFHIGSNLWVEPLFWTLDLKVGISYPGKPPNGQQPDTTYLIDALDLIALLNGKLNSAQAYLSGKLKLLGNTAAAFKFQHFINETVRDNSVDSKEEEISVMPTPSFDMTPILDAIPIDGLKCDVIFEFIRSRLSSEPELVAKMPFVVQININKNKVPMAVWTIDTKIPGGRVYRSAPINAKPDATLTIEDDDYVSLLFGKLNPQRAFMKGLVKIKGNIMLLQRLDTLWNQIQKTRRDPELPVVKDVLLNTQLQKGLRSEIVFFDLIQRLVRSPGQLPSGSSVRFSITKNGQAESEWLIGFDEIGNFNHVKHQNREKSGGEQLVPIAGQAELELVVDDEDFVRLSRDPSYKLGEAIATSRVTATGDQSLLPKLEQAFQRHPSLQPKL